MPGNPPQPGPGPSDAELARMSREDLVTLGGKMDGVEVIYSEQPVRPGSPAERRAERQVAAAFAGAGLSALAFMVIFVAWPWQVETPGGGYDLSALYTPLLGLMMGLALTLVGVGVVLWAKKLMPYEVTVQDRHEGASPEIERQTTAATLVAVGNATGIARRTLVKRSLGFGGLMLGLMAVFPLGGLIKKPGTALFETPWEPGMRLLTLGGLPIRPADMRPGALQTVFPPVEGGARSSDGVAMLIRLLPNQVDEFRPRPGQEDFHWNDFVAYSKICTHAGCPVSLYEQETARILCPCHQSQFVATDGARSIFGPASRSLPQLAVEVDADGYFVAKSDFIEPIGPAFWERST
ncbi:MAG: Rieske (2Fe-2S) protein [Geodermatophilaceae bacterium]|nr:Rieske (2Fe-2S) protein [Geodermatophilaceae bacterium]